MSRACPLCGSGALSLRARAHGSDFLACGDCGLVHRDPLHWPVPEAELAHYQTHRNDPDDPGYRGWLDRLALPLGERLPPGSSGLDFGCGPGPALAGMLRARGHRMAVWDPFYAPDAAALEGRYDFITCTEVAEHFHAPGESFALLDTLLRPGGWLGVMTSLVNPERDIATWRYARDPTHVCFYSAASLDWLARRHGWTLHRPADDVVLFQKR